LMWRKGMTGANLNAWIELQQAHSPQISELSLQLPAPA